MTVFFFEFDLVCVCVHLHALSRHAQALSLLLGRDFACVCVKMFVCARVRIIVFGKKARSSFLIPCCLRSVDAGGGWGVFTHFAIVGTHVAPTQKIPTQWQRARQISHASLQENSRAVARTSG